jgi:outer membrane protein OmpA-like peptidoglycan-associated protein
MQECNPIEALYDEVAMFRRSMLAVCLIAPALSLVSCAQTPPAPTTSTVVIFFTADSASLDTAAQAAIQQAATTAKQRPGVAVRVRGFAAPDAGSTAFNRSLSQTRAEGVVDALVNAGVARSQIKVETRGAVAYDLMPTESRRVEIVIG